jgi:hypothetical protein
MFYFGALGGGMLPMTLIHPWNFVILIYIIGLTYSVCALFEKSMLTPKAAFIFLLSVMGVGLFVYFQGRSHNWNLLVVMGNALILLAVFADMLFEKIKKTKFSLLHNLALILIVSVLGFSCVDLFQNHDKLNKLTKQTTERLAQLDEQEQIEKNIDFIKEWLPETTEKIFIHTSNKYQALYFGAANKRSVFNPCIIDIHVFENSIRLKNKMLLDSSDVFIETPNFYYHYVQETNAAMAATRSVKAANDRMVYLKKRTYETLATPVLEETSKDVLLYEKFYDDTTSLNKRIDYALHGRDSLLWENRFSIEAIFYAEQQAYQANVIFGNFADSCGIELINVDTSRYVLRWKQNIGVDLDFPKGRWHYLVIQADKQTMYLFLNGQLLHTYRIDNHQIELSYKNFFIGGKGTGQQYFTGAISEILVKNGWSSPDEIRKKQQKIGN